MVADIILRGAEKRVFAKLKHYLLNPDFTGGQKLDVLHEIEHSTALFDTGYCELALQSDVSQMFVDKWMNLDVVLDISIPSFINAVLKSNLVNFECINYFRSDSNLYLSTSPRLHREKENKYIYKCIETIEDRQFLATINCCVSLPEAL